MRISDWSSDVCSSDLSTDTIPGLSKVVANATVYYENQGFAIRLSDRYRDKYRGEYSALFGQRQYRYTLPENQLDLQLSYEFADSRRLPGLRSEERRVLKGCARTCRFWGAPEP